MSVIGTLEAAIVARLAAVLTLPAQVHPKVDVRAWPERPRDFKMTHPAGCAMVIYKRSVFDDSGSTNGMLVEFDAEFEVGLISRTLREASSDAIAATGVGIYDLLESCRTALMGWQPEQAAGAVRLRSEEFDDYKEGTWGYSLRFCVPMRTVAERDCVTGPWATDGPNSCCTTAPPVTSLTFHQP